MRISDWSSDVCSSDLPVFADHAVDQRRLARVGAPDDRELHRAERRVLIVFAFDRRKSLGFLGVMPLDDRAQRVEQVDDALAMFGAECDRIVETERIALHQAVFPLLPFRLLDEEDDRREIGRTAWWERCVPYV